jgi:hypothetical protein
MTGRDDQGDAASAAIALIGNSTDNVFTICDDEDPTVAFNATMDEVNIPIVVKDHFAECLDNAAASTTQQIVGIQAQIFSLQESSLSTNVKPQAEIPTVNIEPQNQNPTVNAQLKNPTISALTGIFP